MPRSILLLLLCALACRKTRPCGDDAVELSEGTVEATVQLAWDEEVSVFTGPVLEYLLPEDTVGFLATVDLPGVATGFSRVHFSRETWIDAQETGAGGWYTAPYFHWATLGGTLVAPIDADTVPDAGCLQLQPAALGGGDARLLLTVATHAPDAPVLDLDIVVVGETPLYREDLEEALDVVDRLWRSGGGPGVGAIEVLPQGGATLLRYADSSVLRAARVEGARAGAVRIFFVEDYLPSDGTLGEAGGIPGPLELGVEEAGVIVALDPHRRVGGGVDTQLLGEVLAHEVGHQLGLFHTTESDGTRTEPIADTPECPAAADVDGDRYFSAEECEAWDGTNFMFWVAGEAEQDAITAEQGLVLVSSVLVREGP